jgi:hypothetical protein
MEKTKPPTTTGHVNDEDGKPSFEARSVDQKHQEQLQPSHPQNTSKSVVKGFEE